jgi:peptidoglycan/LPS O-acetylase OafA/YrhL
MQQAAPNKQTRIFFPNLDGLRFLCFFAVFLHHCYLTFFSYTRESSPGFFNTQEFLFKYGTLGVNFFFVLSGFLITFLLLKERELTGTIHVGNFYVRRILRIWPLYFLCLFIGFVLFPLMKKMSGEAMHESANPLYYIFLAGNFDYMHTWPVKPDAILLSVLWSVCVEEQFYLTWPLILRFTPVKYYKYIFIGIILFSLGFRSFYTAGTEADYAVRYFHTFSLIGDMALGGLLAYYVSFPNRFQRFVSRLRWPAVLGIYAGAIIFSLFKEEIFSCGVPVIFERLVIGFFFGMIILEQNFAQGSLFKFGKSKLLSRLGIYTYGLYFLHLLGMYAAVLVVVKMGWPQTNMWVAIGSALLGLFLSIVISIASFHFFEKWFLKLKNRFAFITR